MRQRIVDVTLVVCNRLEPASLAPRRFWTLWRILGALREEIAAALLFLEEGKVRFERFRW